MPSAGMCVCVRARVSANDSPTTPRARCSGLTATVYYGIEKATNREVAVKLMSRRTVSLSPTLMREISILKALKHPSIVELYDVFYDENEDLYLVMELAHGQELFDSLLEKRVYTEDTARAIVRRVLTALAYVHKLGIAHRDLKPENIIIKEASDAPDGFLLKLVDFGFANIVADGMATPLGTLGYKVRDAAAALHAPCNDEREECVCRHTACALSLSLTITVLLH